MGFTEMFIYHFINGILDLSIPEQLDEPPDVFEIILTIKSLLSDKPAGSDEIPAELLKSGLEPPTLLALIRFFCIMTGILSAI